MSNISNRHNVVPFTSGESKPFSGQRLAKVGYKSSKTNPAKFPSVCASIPVLSNWTENQNQRLLPTFRSMIQDVQDKIIRSLYESSDGKLTSVSDEEISVDQVISYLEAESTGDRLTREIIGDWFDANLSDALTIIFCEKLGTQDTDDLRVKQQLAAYRGLYQAMSKDSGAVQDTQLRGLLKALEFSTDSETTTRMSAKITASLDRPKLADLLEL